MQHKQTKTTKKVENLWICQQKAIPLHRFSQSNNGDPLAQLVEHHTFNVGVLGSNPKRIT